MANKVKLFIENPTPESVAYYSPHISERVFRRHTVGAYRTLVEVDTDKVEQIVADIKSRHSYLRIERVDKAALAKEPTPIPDPPAISGVSAETVGYAPATLQHRRGRKTQQSAQTSAAASESQSQESDAAQQQASVLSAEG